MNPKHHLTPRERKRGNTKSPKKRGRKVRKEKNGYFEIPQAHFQHAKRKTVFGHEKKTALLTRFSL